MYGIIKLGNKYGWYMYDDAGNTTKEGKELFDTEDECQAFTDKLGGKTDATVEVESDPTYKIIKLGNKFGYYQTNENGDTVMEGKEVFARHSECQKFLNEKFPLGKTATVAPGTAPENDGKLNAPIQPPAVLGEWPADTVYPYAFTEADLEKFPVLAENGVTAGDEVDSQENLVLALTPKA